MLKRATCLRFIIVKNTVHEGDFRQITAVETAAQEPAIMKYLARQLLLAKPLVAESLVFDHLVLCHFSRREGAYPDRKYRSKIWNLPRNNTIYLSIRFAERLAGVYSQRLNGVHLSIS